MKEEVSMVEVIDADNQALAKPQSSELSVAMDESKKEAALAEMGKSLSME
jgi:hypothetical protein